MENPDHSAEAGKPEGIVDPAINGGCQGCGVPLAILSRLEGLADRIERCADRAESKLEQTKLDRDWTIDFQAALLELMTDFAKDLNWRAGRQRLKELEARDRIHRKLPPHFWKLEKSARPEIMLLRRARFLIHEMQAGVDEVWGAMVEFVESSLGSEVDEDRLKRVVLYAKRNPGVGSFC